MANLSNSSIQIAGIGHVYYAPVDTAAPDLYAFTFGDGTTLSTDGWTWLGDTSSDNLIEFSKDGGDSTVKRTWDRANVRNSRADTTYTVTINSVNMGQDTINLAFPGSTFVASDNAYDLQLAGSVEKAILVVVEDGSLVSGFLFRRVDLSGDLPVLSLEDFSEIALSGTLLKPPSGKTEVQFLPPRTVTGASSAVPTVTKIDPSSTSVGSTITVTGTNFDGVRTVTVGGVDAVFTKVSSTSITATVPSGASTGDVIVTNGMGSSVASTSSKITIA